MAVEDVVLGDTLDAMSPQALADCVRRQSVFARVSPIVKLKIVQTLKADGKVVAMIGDGVNDAIAMQAADVSVAMGKRGTDVARRTAALILLEDDFAALIAGIGHGRTIFTNMQKSMSYLLAVHIPIAGLAMSPMLLNTAPLLLPLHMACLELVIDPACSVVFENEPAHANAMRVPPRNVKQAVLEREQIQKAVIRGLFALGMVLLCYGYAVSHTDDLALHRSMVFVTLVMGNIMLMTAYRQHQSRASTYEVTNPRMWLLSLGAAVLTTLFIYWPLASELFKFTPLTLKDLSVALVFGTLTGLSRYVAK
jgi:Ca2+-transporting ATPase